jgi:ATP synthase protein I
MLKRVMVYDGIILLLSLIVSIIFFKEFTVIVMIGLGVAYLNFLLNSIITEYAMKASKGAILVVFGAVARIAVAGAFAFILYNGNKANVVAYIIGYSLHYASMVISAASQKNKTEREG